MDENYSAWVRSAWDTVQPWMQRNVTFGLVLAIFTEVPRWVFAFVAAHEPVWAGCALAILMAYACAHAWDEFFVQHDRLLLSLNLLSLFFGVYTIAPVLYMMASATGNDAHSIALANVFSAWFIGSWAFVLSCTTFLPLIQVAVVEVRRRERVQPAMQSKPKKAATVQLDTVQPSAPTVQELAQDDAPPIDARTEALQMHGEGMPPTEIARLLQQKESTVRSWIRRSNGATKERA